MDDRSGTVTERTLGGDLTLAADGSPSGVRSSDVAIELTPGTTVDRYVIVSRLGAGAMGVVYAAYDPKLDRKVALKLLRAVVTGPRSERHRTRLAREAKALARIAHPNVVTVFDVGTFEERVWVAMEFVSGMTLGRWLAGSRPATTEILDVLAAAGRGLQAAHVAGLVHRDFKPDNVMVEIVEGAAEGETAKVGRVRVMDFGLATGDRSDSGLQPLERPAGSTPVQADAKQMHPADSDALTMIGDLVGTPAYMSPEQHLAEEADPRSDQFSFCVVLWEALFRERPYGSGSAHQVGAAILEGRRRPPPAGHDVPRWMIAILERGLHASRNERWPSMSALLETLERGRQRRRTRWLIGGAGVLVVMGMTAFGGWRAYLQAIQARCDLAGADVQAQWPGRAEAIEQSLAAFPPAWDKTKPWLDRWAEKWTEARIEVCVGHRVEGTLDDVEARAAVACLSAQRTELAAMLDSLRDADALRAGNSVLSASELSRPQSCVERLQTVPWPPANDWEQVERIRDRLASLRPKLSSGGRPDVRAQAEDALADARTLGWTPLEAEALFAQGAIDKSQQRYEDAEGTLEQAYWLAGKSGDEKLAAEVAMALAYLTGYDLARYDEGLRWGAHAEMMFSRLGDGHELAGARLLAVLGAINMYRGELDRAAEQLEAAEQTMGRVLGEMHPARASAITDLGLVHFSAGRFDEARGLLRRAREIWQRVLGPRHPRVAAAMGYEALVEAEQGDPYLAERLMRQAQEINEEVYGPDDRLVGQNMLNRSPMLSRLGRHAESVELSHRALRILERSLGSEHPDVAAALNNLASAEGDLGRFDAALQHGERSLTIRRRSQGPRSAAVVSSLENMAELHAKRGDPDRAAALFEEALGISEEVNGAEHHATASILHGWGELLLDRGDDRSAKRHLARSLSIREAAGVSAEDRAATRFALARATWSDSASRAAARGHAERALGELAGLGTHVAPMRTRIETWLAEHRL